MFIFEAAPSLAMNVTRTNFAASSDGETILLDDTQTSSTLPKKTNIFYRARVASN